MRESVHLPALLLLVQLWSEGVGGGGGLRTNYYNHGSSPGPHHHQLDYHLHPDSSSDSLNRPFPAHTEIHRETRGNVTTYLGAVVRLSCDISEGVKVSWTKYISNYSDPVALSYNNQVFVTDARISVETTEEETILSISRVRQADEGFYSCHLNTNNRNIKTFHLLVQVPNVTILDGFGRFELIHYYKVGSSLEVICQIKMWKLPLSWRMEDLSEFVAWEKNGERILSNPKQYRQRIMTEIERENIVSRLAITQATREDSGNYSCKIPNYRRTSINLIIQEAAEPIQKAILNLGGFHRLDSTLLLLVSISGWTPFSFF